MKRILTGAALLGSLVSFTAMAQPSAEDAQEAVIDRQALFQVLAFSNSPLGLMARGTIDFDQDEAVQAAERVAMLAEMIPEVFAVDTREADVETAAFDSIWDSKDDFADLAMDLRNGAMEAKSILEEQGQGGLRGALQQIGPKCGACHDRFRED